MTISNIHYQVADLKQTETFYRDVMGFSTEAKDAVQKCNLAAGAALTFHEADLASYEALPDSSYWKVGLTMPDLNRAVDHLDKIGWPVSRPRQFLDIGYMCHLADPSGMAIELLQQGFEGRRADGPEGHDIGAQATLAHLTLRAETYEAAHREWVLGAKMKLMSVQAVQSHGFTLYFFARTEETPPNTDLTAVANREWLWRRPYTLVEVQVYDDGRRIVEDPHDRVGFRRAET